MQASARTLTPGAPAPGVGASAETMRNAEQLLTDHLGASVVHRYAPEPIGDQLYLAVNDSDRRQVDGRTVLLCWWPGCDRPPTRAMHDRKGRVAVCEQHWPNIARRSVDIHSTLIARAADPAYTEWSRRAASAGGCANPVRLQRQTSSLDPSTGELSPVVDDTRSDGVIYKGCGNRRAEVCPACAGVYRADAFQLVLAGLRGGKGIPDAVAGHPAIFATLTGPSFGLVHTRRTDKNDQVLPCRPRRRAQACKHGVVLRCRHTHGKEDPRLGQPLCADCYDYNGHAVWNAWAGELWRRTRIAVDRAITRHQPDGAPPVRISYGKAAEMQHRGLIHYHGVLRLDGVDPDDRDAVIAPPAWASVFVLAHALREAFTATRFITPPHPDRATGWLMHWGDSGKGLDLKPIRHAADAEISREQVAGYLAKYSTKSTETTGHVSKKLHPDTVDLYADDSHPGRIIDACWTLGRPEAGEDWARLRRWAHQLGYGGHFFTKSRRYTATFKAVRAARRTWIRSQADLDTEHTNAAQVTVTTWAFLGIGWRTTGDALLAQTSAALAREHRRMAREEILSA